MKVGILTFINAYNMGAVLQGYALNKKLNSYDNVECELIDYVNENIVRQYAFPKLSEFLTFPKRSVARCLSRIAFAGRYKQISRFAHSLEMSPRCTKENFVRIADRYDVIVVGSDQVWNPAIIGDDTAFLLDGVKTGKTSYAASIGLGELGEERRKIYQPLLEDFRSIAVRENSAAEILKSWGIERVNVTCDPVFLLDASQWSQLAEPTQKGKYIFVYKINNCRSLIKYARELSKKTGLPVVFYMNDVRGGGRGRHLKSVTPREWLGLIKNAEYVVTNSFHATAFSIIFKRNFAVEILKKNNANSRIEQLLGSFELEDRVIDEKCSIVYDDIDYSDFDRKISDYRKTSIDYIESNIVKQ